MADENDSGEKSELPTGKRMGEARSDGMVIRSVELSQVLSITTAFMLLQYLAPSMWGKLILLFRDCFTSRYSTEFWSIDDLRYNFYMLVWRMLPDLLVLLVITAFFGAGSTLLQTNFNLSWKMVKPKLSRLNPIAGLKRLVSIQNFVQLLKALAKFAIIAPMGYLGFYELLPQLLTLMQMPVDQLLPITGSAMALVFWKIMKLMTVLAIIDYFWQRYRVTKQLKMTKVEVKDERKSTEGDDRTRMQFRQRAMQRARQRMLQSVKSADVIVTNPTHFSVALKYSMERGSAPKVVAKGQDHMAFKIREIARQAGIPIVERKPLARALYKDVEVGQEIPYELFSAVAELLAYVYRIRGRNPFANRATR